MKTSNKFILAFLLFVVSGTMALFVATRSHEENKSKNLCKEDIVLPPFSVIFCESKSMLCIESGDSNKLTISYPEKKKEKRPASFVVKNDTLYIVEKTDSDYFETTLLVQCSNVQTIIARHNNAIRINKINLDSLTIRADNSELILGSDSFDKSQKSANRLAKLTFIAQNKSSLSIHHIMIDKMIVKSQRSRIEFYNESIIKNLSAEIQDSSMLTFHSNKVKQLNFKSDQTSQYFLNKY